MGISICRQAGAKSINKDSRPHFSFPLDAVIVAQREGREYRKNACNRWYVYLGVLAVVALVTEGETDLVRSYVQAFNIPSGAMMPTLLIGDHIYVDKSIQHGWKLPERGEGRRIQISRR